MERPRRGNLASVALRATGDTRMNLGLFVEEFTREHGIVGGGHPTSAGAKINSRSLPLFLDDGGLRKVPVTVRGTAAAAEK